MIYIERNPLNNGFILELLIWSFLHEKYFWFLEFREIRREFQYTIFTLRFSLDRDSVKHSFGYSVVIFVGLQIDSFIHQK
jgi:hypothetical protein